MLKILFILTLALIFQLINPGLTFAYGLLTHIELMNQTIKILGNEFKYIFDTFLIYATLGAIGPDIFRGSLFKKLHGNEWTEFVYGMLDYLRGLAPGEKQKKLTVYLYGYLTHLAGDINGDTLSHRISNQREHNKIFNQVYFHQDLYVACKYHSAGGNKANLKIALYELDTDIIQMFRIVFDKLEGGAFELEWKTFISAYDRTRLFLWWLIKEANQPFLRIFLPYSFSSKYLLKFDQSFEDSKQTAMKFIQSANEFLYDTGSKEGYNKLREVIKEDYIGCPYM
ncbi:MAG: zinc dependent phospholipase C family protein [bacterium]|nr:zinc dependent phospholipase C family protein [bacterium]